MTYILSEPLQRAVDVALYLNRPLLLCGEPGTGKTTLAKYLAATFSGDQGVNNTLLRDVAPFYPKPLIFNTKTTSTSSELFYSYDGLSRLRDTYAQVKKPIGEYIKLNALGQAIVLKYGAELFSELKGEGMEEVRKIKGIATLPDHPTSSIVLIDEIDKAPRDFPNDILNEIENLEFEIRELDAKIPSAQSNGKILVIMTSNNEKNLPDAFLRRCIYHYIKFPEPQDLENIIRVHFVLPDRTQMSSHMGIIRSFLEMRSHPFVKKPATAELIDFLRILEKEKLLHEACQPYEKMPDGIKKQLERHLGTLFKNNNDTELINEVMETI